MSVVFLCEGAGDPALPYLHISNTSFETLMSRLQKASAPGRWPPEALPSLAQDIEQMLAAADDVLGLQGRKSRKSARLKTAEALGQRAVKLLAVVQAAIAHRYAVTWG